MANLFNELFWFRKVSYYLPDLGSGF